jgi:S1-C subfamily serine protease
MGWIALLSGLCIAASTSLLAASDALALQQRLIEVFEQNKSAIVRVKAAYRGPDEDGKAQVMLRVGTGFFISQEGHVLVSASRAFGASRVWIEYQGKAYATEAVGHDLLTNISVLRVLEPPEVFSIISMDTNVKRPDLGAIAIAIACPLDFEPSPVMGIVTGMEKKLGNKVFPTEYIRTSISVDAGQGGCPILDINGRFIGMTIASIPEINSSYCLPVDALTRVRDDLLFSGHVIHSWMGFEVGEKLNVDNAYAVYLSKVIEDGPAHEAGLLEGDRLVSIGGHGIEDVSDVPGAVFFTRANQFTSIKVQRGEEELEFSVKTLPRPETNPIIEPTAVTPADLETGEPQKDLTAFFDWSSGEGEPKAHKFNLTASNLELRGATPVSEVTPRPESGLDSVELEVSED